MTIGPSGRILYWTFLELIFEFFFCSFRSRTYRVNNVDLVFSSFKIFFHKISLGAPRSYRSTFITLLNKYAYSVMFECLFVSTITREVPKQFP